VMASAIWPRLGRDGLLLSVGAKTSLARLLGVVPKLGVLGSLGGKTVLVSLDEWLPKLVSC
jgi:hypothetical protein